MLVIAYALAGRIDIDIQREPLGKTADGADVFLADLWPSADEIAEAVVQSGDAALYRENYARLFDGEELWRKLPSKQGPLFAWDSASTYIREPPFFSNRAAAPDRLDGARVLGLFGDSLTTDHISPAGEIPKESEAGRYLAAQGVPQKSFNAFTQRRGNHEVMLRGAFANPRIRNALAPEAEGGVTRDADGAVTSVFAAAERYRAEGAPLIVLGGRDYGMGSSRDWAAKGTALLGVRAVIAENFERIHRSNLVALGVTPLTFAPDESWKSLGLTGAERYTLEGLDAARQTGAPVRVIAQSADGAEKRFLVYAALDSETERACLAAGGMFATIKDALMRQAAQKETA
ncbi:MAG: hypothetical protein R3C16_10290 [Hyphomonadaceae bacterium]